MEIVYISSKDRKVYGMTLQDDEMPVDYLAAWISPNEYETLSEQQKRHMWMTLWIEAAAVGSNPSSLAIEAKGMLWNGPGGISKKRVHIDSYAHTIGLSIYGWSPSELRWEGLPESETFKVQGIRYGIMGALARFAWQDPDGWLAHASEDVSPGRIDLSTSIPDPEDMLKDVTWCPPGERMNKQFWSKTGAISVFTETDPHRRTTRPGRQRLLVLLSIARLVNSWTMLRRRLAITCAMAFKASNRPKPSLVKGSATTTPRLLTRGWISMAICTSTASDTARARVTS